MDGSAKLGFERDQENKERSDLNPEPSAAADKQSAGQVVSSQAELDYMKGNQILNAWEEVEYTKMQMMMQFLEGHLPVAENETPVQDGKKKVPKKGSSPLANEMVGQLQHMLDLLDEGKGEDEEAGVIVPRSLEWKAE